jgi:site-specific DNA recombinase
VLLFRPLDAALYARISLDRQEGEGVARQLELCRVLCAERGWDVGGEYVDNGVSAYQLRVRPSWVRLLRDLKAGRVGAVVAYHPDRLYRRLPDLEGLIDAIESQGVQVATVRAGDLDLATASGRLTARLLGVVARGESERNAERVRDAKGRIARAGIPSSGGSRPFGYEDDRVTVRPGEAAEVAAIVEALAFGTSTLTVEVRRLNDQGLLTPDGNWWSHQSLRRAITSPRVAGLRSYRGQIVADASWPAIVDRGAWELLRAQVTSRKRGRPSTDRYLLSGLLACELCGGSMYAHPDPRGHRYRCHPSTISKVGHGCGKVTIQTTIADAHVEAVIEEWITSPEFVAAAAVFAEHGDDQATRAELDEIERRQHRLGDRYGQGQIGDTAFEQASRTLARRRADLEARAVHHTPTSVDPATVRAAWPAASVAARRPLIAALVDLPILVAPGRGTDRLTVRRGPVWG